MTIKESNKKRKWFGCLRCGRRMWTDRCHRICRKCHRRRVDDEYVRPAAPVSLPVTVGGYGLDVFDELTRDDIHSLISDDN